MAIGKALQKRPLSSGDCDVSRTPLLRPHRFSQSALADEKEHKTRDRSLSCPIRNRGIPPKPSVDEVASNPSWRSLLSLGY